MTDQDAVHQGDLSLDQENLDSIITNLGFKPTSEGKFARNR